MMLLSSEGSPEKFKLMTSKTTVLSVPIALADFTAALSHTSKH